MRERPRCPDTTPSRGWYLFSGALVILVSLVTAVALSGTSAQAQTQSTPPTNTTPPSVSGIPSLGQTLNATSGSWSGDAPISFAYEWRRCNTSGASCANIPGATGSTYVVDNDDVGFTLRVQVTATNAAGVAVAQSSATEVVTASSPPVNTGEPAISGAAVQGQTLTASTGTWSSSTALAFAYQWVRCGTDGGASDGSNCAFISGATGSTYTLQSADVGHRMRVRVSATNTSGKETVASNATATVQSSGAPANSQQPSISGAVRQGQTLTATVGSWSGTQPISYAFQWVRCGIDGGAPDGSNCTVIPNAKSSKYILTADDVGRRLRIRVTASNSQGSKTAASNATAPVQSSGPVLPPGAIRLPDGKISIPATSVSLPARLIIDGVRFTPNPVRTRASTIELRVHVVDTRGYVVRDAVVFARSTPLLTTTSPEQRTGQDGWVSLRMIPRASFPLRTGYNVQFFLRARKDGGNVLAGVSTRRLVQVGTAR